MLDFLKNILQLILSPGNAWEDLGKEKVEPEVLLSKGLLPLLGIMGLTQFLSLLYHPDTSFGRVLTSALASVGAYFVTIYIGKLIFELTLPGMIERFSSRKAFTTVIYGVALMAVIQIIDNCLPWKSVVLSLLPLYAVLVLYRAHQYLGIRQGSELRYLGIAALALVLVPILISTILVLIYPGK